LRSRFISEEIGIDVKDSKIRNWNFKQKTLKMIVIVLLGSLVVVSVPCAYSWNCRRLANYFVTGVDIHVTWVGHDVETVVISESPRIVADHYAAPHSQELVIFAHGSDSKGRRSGLSRLLADGLRDRGISVLALDLRGFGDSEDPPLPLAEDFRFEDDIRRAAHYALDKGIAKPGNIIYVGYSLGAGVVLHAGRNDPKPSAIVVIGAPDIQIMSENAGVGWINGFAANRLEDMKISAGQKSIETLADYLLKMNPKAQLAQGGLPPTLFVYGELGKGYGVPLVRDFLSRNETLNDLHMVPNTAHSYNIVDGFWNLTFYDPEVLKALAGAIEDWTVRWSRDVQGHS
jgi:pimeloyl-ACP methyl ester carboxylesterase